jgi:hypothetical protein
MSMIRFNMKAFFFDRASVTDMVDKSAKKGLGYFGGVVRKIAKRSIVEAKNWFDHSRAGNPPKSHVGTLKRMIYYAWDPDHRSVVIGPELFSPMSGAPENLEHGGTAFIRRKKRVVRIAKRPFMQPAFDKEVEKLPDYIAGTLRGSNA